MELSRQKIVVLVDIAQSFAGIQRKRTYNLNAPSGVNGRNLRKTSDWIESEVEALSCV